MMSNEYKQTEVGVIPEDWEIKHLNDFGDVISGGTPSTTVKEYWDGGIAWCTPSDITKTQGKYIRVTERTISKVGLKNSAAILLPENSILLCTRATIGELKVSAIPMTTNQGFKNLRSNSSANIDFLYYLLQTKKSDMLELSIGSTFLEISKTALCQIPMQTPSIPEQELIAEALSDVDSMVSSLEKLIAKKKAVKQGAMQELLTGKKRLPGFTGEWKTYKLGAFAKIIMGQSPDSRFYNDSDGMPMIQGNADIRNRKTQVRFYTTQATKKAFVGDILFTVRAPVGNVAKTEFDCCIGRGVCALREANDFLFHYLVFLEPFWSTLSCGSTFDAINSNTLANTEIFIPSDTAEQMAIALVLSDMENEIEGLQQKLDKICQLKQGMMQQLLTGKIRLI